MSGKRYSEEIKIEVVKQITERNYPIGQFIQGLLAYWNDEVRVYVVTFLHPMEYPVYDRWPRLILL